MADNVLTRSLLNKLEASPAITISDGDKVVVLGDLHMGNGGPRDDLANNGELLRQALADWYLPKQYTLVLNGDIEEAQRFDYPSIRRRWGALFDLFDEFNAAGRFYKLIGNHDEELRELKDYPYSLLEALKIETDSLPLYVYHGHQTSRFYSRHKKIARSAVRYFLKPMGIKNIASARSRKRRFAAEKAVYDFSRRNGLASIMSHTHRPLFESLAMYDLLRFEIERLCRSYTQADDRSRSAIVERVVAIRHELLKLKRKERRSSIKKTLYGDELPVPCVFNTGSAIGKRGITALELEANRIALVYWYKGEGFRHWLRSAVGTPTPLGASIRRVVLNSEALDYVRARIELLA